MKPTTLSFGSDISPVKESRKRASEKVREKGGEPAQERNRQPSGIQPRSEPGSHRSLVSKLVGGLLAMLLILTAPAALGASVAIVEEVSADNLAVAEFEFLQSGQVIELPPQAQIVISYFRSCQRESIRGGRVTVGDGESQVDNGRIVRQQVDCEPAQLDQQQMAASKSAVAVFRKAPGAKTTSDAAVSRESRRIYGLSPVVLVSPGESWLEIREQNAPRKKPLRVKLKQSVTDLFRQDIQLQAGKRYLFSIGPHSVEVVVDPFAEAGPLPLVSRWIKIP